MSVLYLALRSWQCNRNEPVWNVCALFCLENLAIQQIMNLSEICVMYLALGIWQYNRKWTCLKCVYFILPWEFGNTTENAPFWMSEPCVVLHSEISLNEMIFNSFPHTDAFWRLPCRRLLKTFCPKEICSLFAIQHFAVMVLTLFNNFLTFIKSFCI